MNVRRTTTNYNICIFFSLVLSFENSEILTFVNLLLLTIGIGCFFNWLMSLLAVISPRDTDRNELWWRRDELKAVLQVLIDPSAIVVEAWRVTEWIHENEIDVNDYMSQGKRSIRELWERITAFRSEQYCNWTRMMTSLNNCEFWAHELARKRKQTYMFPVRIASRVAKWD